MRKIMYVYGYVYTHVYIYIHTQGAEVQPSLAGVLAAGIDRQRLSEATVEGKIRLMLTFHPEPRALPRLGVR